MLQPQIKESINSMESENSRRQILLKEIKFIQWKILMENCLFQQI